MVDAVISDEPVVPRAAVSAAIFREGRILLVKRERPPAAGLWSLPGGHIEPGEPACLAVERELREETGICANIFGVAGVKDVVHQNDRGSVIFHRVIIVFYGLWRAGELRAGSDAAAAIWQSTDALHECALTEGLAEIIANTENALRQFKP